MNFKQPFVLIAALFCFAPASDCATPAVPKPNVLFICVDDLKPLLGCYGDKVIKSPNIDRLAARGVLFERAYCNQAVCAPSRNSLLTGVRPTTLGIYDLGTNFRLASSNAVTLPQYFLKHGYRTEALGKIFHVGHGNHDDAASWSVPLFKANSIAYVLPENRTKRTREEALFANETDVAQLPRGAAWESADVPDNAYPDGRIADEAMRRLRAAKEKPTEPFFLAVGFLKPHLPFCAPKKYWDLYERASFSVPAQRTTPEGAPKYAPSGWGELRQYSGIPDSGPLSGEQARTMIHGYHAAVSYMDAQLGKVLDELDRLGLATNTIVLFWGDHGWHLGDHGWWCKHDNYEQATRIPLIISAPGLITPGKRAANALVETVDIYPTLAELAGLPTPQVPQGIEGKSFVAALRDPNLGTKDYVCHVYPRGERIGRAVRTARYRLVEWKVPGRAADSAELELYDYEKDPLETKNLATEKPAVVAQLQAMLAELPEAKPQMAGVKPLTAKQIQDRTALFERKDTNQNNELGREEFLANQPDPAAAPKRFERFDTNKDGRLSRDEFIHMGSPPTGKILGERRGPVRVVDHALVDDTGPFLGLGVSYFTALWRCRHDRQRFERDLQFLSAQGFNYHRMFSMVGSHPSWDGLEIAPVTFTNRAGKRVDAWPDYWRQLTDMLDLAYDRHGMRAQITIFADAQLMPNKQDRLEHMRQLLANVVRGREEKIILLEVANEAWQNGFPGKQGVADLNEFTKYLADRTDIPVATTSNHGDDFTNVYAHSAADIATWHFSRDHRADDGWKPVYDCWPIGDLRGFPPVSSNEPIGPGSSVATETSSIRLVMAAAFAYVAKLPMYVFHSQAGVRGKTRFEDTPGVNGFRHLRKILPGDLPNWQRHDGRQNEAPFTVFADKQPNRYWPEVPASRDGCLRNTGSRKEDRFVCVPIGIREGGLELQAREAVEFEAFDPLTGEIVRSAEVKKGERTVLPARSGGLIIKGRILSSPKQ